MKQRTFVSISILSVLITLIILTISARGCLGRNNTKTRTGSSDYTAFMINAPSNLIATAVSTSQINLSWTDNSNNEDGFEIERRTVGIDYTLIGTVGSNMVSYYDTGLTLGISYYYRVRAFNTIGDKSLYSGEANTAAVMTIIWSKIAAGGNHSLAIATNGMIYSWGYNLDGQLGLGDSVDRLLPNQLGTEIDWQLIAAGISHSLGVKSDGTLWSWGANASGQLGMGDTQYVNFEPWQVGNETNWVLVAAGSYNSVARKINGTLWSWGNNYYGQLGLGDTGANALRTTPTQIISGTDSDWSSISAGAWHTIAIKTNPAGGGTIWTWGYNYYGILGIGETAPIILTTPCQIGTASDWAAMVAGEYNTIARRTDNTIWAWGLNNLGQLGLGDSGTGINRFTPAAIGSNSDWSELAAGNCHTTSIKTNLTLWLWGNNDFGQLGFGDTVSRNTPTQLGLDSDWSTVSIGGSYSAPFTLALKTSGTLWSWGANSYGQLGLDDTNNRSIPTLVVYSVPYSPSSLGATVISSSQINLSWGDNSFNENGFQIERSILTNTNYSLLTTLVPNSTSYADKNLSIDTIYYYRVRAYNAIGMSSYSNTVSATPTLFAPLSLNLEFISNSQIDLTWLDNSSDDQGFKIERKIKSNGTWLPLAEVAPDITSYSDISPTEFASNTYYYYRVKAFNQFGESIYSNEAKWVSGGTWNLISAGGFHNLARSSNGAIWAWGYNQFGQLGTGDTIQKKFPIQIGNDSDWTKINAGLYHNIAGKSNNTLWGWGVNNHGQLGLGYTSDSRNSPYLIDDATNWSVVVAGGDPDDNYLVGHTIGLRPSGQLCAWGSNSYGQLGIENFDETLNPTPVGIEFDWSAIALGGEYSIAIKTNHTIWGWGGNFGGQLGMGEIIPPYTNIPLQIGVDSDWSLVVTAGDLSEDAYPIGQTIALKMNKTLWSWGNNSYGQLGRNNGDTSIPGQVGTDSNWSSIATGRCCTNGIKTNQTLWSWGRNNYGQLGLGDLTGRPTPTQVGIETEWVQIAVGNFHAIALKSNNTIWSWGDNQYGQLGLGDTIDRNVPTLVGE